MVDDFTAGASSSTDAVSPEGSGEADRERLGIVECGAGWCTCKAPEALSWLDRNEYIQL